MEAPQLQLEGLTDPSSLTMAANTASSNNHVIESALATLQPLRDLSRNWDVDIASW
jgi:hypothetical protein